MFRGRFLHTIDEKGRIMVPAKFREELSTRYDECLIVTNFDGCLVAYPREEWHKLEEKLMQKSMVKQMTAQVGYSFLASLLLGQNPAGWQALTAKLLGTSGLLAYSRSHENRRTYLLCGAYTVLGTTSMP